MNRARRTTLGECCEIVSGATPSTGTHAYWDGEIEWATPKDLSDLDGKYISETARRITSEGLASCAATVLPPNSVLFSSRAPIGHVAINLVPMATNQGFKSFVPRLNEVDPSFLYHWLRAHRANLEALGNGATFKEVSKAVIARVEITLPPIDEQRRIADILDKVDAIRRKCKDAIALTEELLRSAFLEMFGDPVTNPKGWPVKPLSSLVAPDDSINYGVVQPGPETDVGVPLVRVGDFDGLSIDVRHLKKIQPDIEAAYTRSRLRGDEVLIACVGATLGKVALADKGLCGANIARAVARVRPSSALNRNYLALFLMMPFVQARFLAEARTVAQPTLNIRQIEQTPILAPPMSEQMAFARLHAQTTVVRARQLEAMNCAQELFRSLSARAFSAADFRSEAPC